MMSVNQKENIYTDIDKINSVLSYLSNVKIRIHNNHKFNDNDSKNIKIEHQLRISTLKGSTLNIIIFNNNIIVVGCNTDNGHYLKFCQVLDDILNSDYIVNLLNK